MSELAANRMIPILPCRSLDDQLAFYVALGFEVTYRQKVPNAFVAIRRGAIELQFFTTKGYGLADSYTTCFVMVPNVDRLYAEFRAGLKQSLRRIPSRGLPRLERAVDAARLLPCSKVDPETTARVLDDALAAVPSVAR